MTWLPLSDGVGAVLTVAGEVCVAAQSGRLRTWHGHALSWVSEIEEPNPARPTILADRVLWGPYAFDLATGAVTPADFARPGPGYQQTAHAWSPDGAMAVAAGRRLDPGSGAPPAAVWLLTGEQRTLLWSGSDVPPRAVCVDPPLSVVGHRTVDVHDVRGALVQSLAGVASPVRIESRAGRLLVVEAGLLSVWQPAAGLLLGRRAGGWSDACLTPDGETVLAVDLSGEIVRLSVSGGLRASDPVPAVGPALAVATDGRTVLASFAQEPGLRVRTL